jgi:hypothetical protein
VGEASSDSKQDLGMKPAKPPRRPKEAASSDSKQDAVGKPAKPPRRAKEAASSDSKQDAVGKPAKPPRRAKEAASSDSKQDAVGKPAKPPRTRPRRGGETEHFGPSDPKQKQGAEAASGMEEPKMRQRSNAIGKRPPELLSDHERHMARIKVRQGKAVEAATAARQNMDSKNVLNVNARKQLRDAGNAATAIGYELAMLRAIQKAQMMGFDSGKVIPRSERSELQDRANRLRNEMQGLDAMLGNVEAQIGEPQEAESPADDEKRVVSQLDKSLRKVEVELIPHLTEKVSEKFNKNNKAAGAQAVTDFLAFGYAKLSPVEKWMALHKGLVYSWQWRHKYDKAGLVAWYHKSASEADIDIFKFDVKLMSIDKFAQAIRDTGKEEPDDGFTTRTYGEQAADIGATVLSTTDTVAPILSGAATAVKTGAKEVDASTTVTKIETGVLRGEQDYNEVVGIKGGNSELTDTINGAALAAGSFDLLSKVIKLAAQVKIAVDKVNAGTATKEDGIDVAEKTVDAAASANQVVQATAWQVLGKSEGLSKVIDGTSGAASEGGHAATVASSEILQTALHAAAYLAVARGAFLLYRAKQAHGEASAAMKGLEDCLEGAKVLGVTEVDGVNLKAAQELKKRVAVGKGLHGAALVAAGVTTLILGVSNPIGWAVMSAASAVGAAVALGQIYTSGKLKEAWSKRVLANHPQTAYTGSAEKMTKDEAMSCLAQIGYLPSFGALDGVKHMLSGAEMYDKFAADSCVALAQELIRAAGGGDEKRVDAATAVLGAYFEKLDPLPDVKAIAAKLLGG